MAFLLHLMHIAPLPCTTHNVNVAGLKATKTAFDRSSKALGASATVINHDLVVTLPRAEVGCILCGDYYDVSIC